jgi:hypothetical protein
LIEFAFANRTFISSCKIRAGWACPEAREGYGLKRAETFLCSSFQTQQYYPPQRAYPCFKPMEKLKKLSGFVYAYC